MEVEKLLFEFVNEHESLLELFAEEKGYSKELVDELITALNEDMKS